ncbi:MAG: tetratricopeptide repeat protein [Elusimicrobia bacterium]|nr:tetratricopeptide repeat protein [Elusimicrobiota bacterium]
MKRLRELRPQEKTVDDVLARLERDPSDLPARLSLGNIFYLFGEPERAIEVFQSIIDQNPNGAALARYHLGITLYRMGRLDEAIPVLEKGFSVNGNIAMFLYWLGVACYHKGDWPKAQRYYEEFLKRCPQSKMAYYHLAVLSAAQKENWKSITCLRKLLEIDTRDTAALYHLANAYVNMRKPTEALGTLRKLLEIDPRDVRAKTMMEHLSSSEP